MVCNSNSYLLFCFILDKKERENNKKEKIIKEGRDRMSKEELFRLFSRFPGQKHVMETCKMGQGKETCRYLRVGSSWECLKANCSLRKNIDKRVENGEIVTKGDNCMGLLGLIIQNQEKLRDKKASYIRYYCHIDANFEKMETGDGILKIIMGKNKKKLEFTFDTDNDNLDIVVDSDGINFFQNLNLGDHFTRRIVIFF